MGRGLGQGWRGLGETCEWLDENREIIDHSEVKSDQHLFPFLYQRLGLMTRQAHRKSPRTSPLGLGPAPEGTPVDLLWVEVDVLGCWDPLLA